MRWGVVRLVMAKELRETLRDRRTLVMMVFVPILLYPLLFVVIEQLALLGQRNLKAKAAEVAVVDPTGSGVAAFLARDAGLHVVPLAAPPLAAVRDGRLDAAVLVLRASAGPATRRPNRSTEPSESIGPTGSRRSADASPSVTPETEAAADGAGTTRVRLVFDASRDRSQHARTVVGERLAAWNDSLLARRLAARGLPAAFARPLAVADSSLASPEKLGGYTLGRVLPMILILMTVLGAFYPAIDLAAGEKERGTLETLLTAPVPAREIVAGKFAAVSAVGFGAAALNLGSMLLTFQSGLFQITRVAKLDFRLPAGSVLVVLAVMVPLAVLFSALFLGIAVRAQSFKEAQNALTPVYIVSIIPAFLASMPGIEFTPGMALVPVGGVAFLFRELLSGTAQPLPSALALLATTAYAAGALVFAARSFGREEVLFGSGSGDAAPEPMAARFRRWRAGGTAEGRGSTLDGGDGLADFADGARGGVPAPGEAMVFIVGVALLFFYLAPQAVAGLGEAGIPVSTVAFIGLPAVLFAVLGPFDARRTLGLLRPSARTLAAALLIALGGIPLGWALGWAQLQLVHVPKELFGQLAKLTTATDARRALWLLLIVAVLPGICEELVFRGVLLRSLAARLAGWRAIVLSALVFGAFHLSFETVLRFLPTFWIGLLMGWVAWHARSTPATMAMHALNNGLAVLVISAPPSVGRLLLGAGEAPNWLLVALGPVLIAAGAALLPRRAEGLTALPAPSQPARPAAAAD